MWGKKHPGSHPVNAEARHSLQQKSHPCVGKAGKGSRLPEILCQPGFVLWRAGLVLEAEPPKTP